MITVKELTKRYGAHTAVDALSFTVDKGQIYGLLGPNGAGKSTLLTALAQGVPYTGLATLSGRDIRLMRPRERARWLGTLAQSHAVSYAFTVEEIVRMGRYAYATAFSGMTGADEAAVEDALSLTGMLAYRNHSVLTLSGGELQRAFLAQVFAQNPRLLLLDEPTNHLDLRYQQQVFALIRQWLQTPGRAAVSVVHDLSLALRYGTHALLLQDGHALASGDIRKALSPQALDTAYGMDVSGWMRGLLELWQRDE